MPEGEQAATGTGVPGGGGEYVHEVILVLRDHASPRLERVVYLRHVLDTASYQEGDTGIYVLHVRARAAAEGYSYLASHDDGPPPASTYGRIEVEP